MTGSDDTREAEHGPPEGAGTEVPGSQPNEQSLPEIDGGLIAEGPEPRFDESKHRAETASKLAFRLIYLFAGALAVHYIIFACLAFGERKDAIASLQDTFNVWLPALVGIVSAAATYYFTKER